MNDYDYEHKATDGSIEPVLMALGLGATYDALALPPRKEEDPDETVESEE